MDLLKNSRLKTARTDNIVHLCSWLRSLGSTGLTQLPHPFSQWTIPDFDSLNLKF